jgi:hypothetical protein
MSRHLRSSKWWKGPVEKWKLIAGWEWGVGRVVYPRSLNLLVYIPLWIILKEIEGTRLICAGK